VWFLDRFPKKDDIKFSKNPLCGSRVVHVDGRTVRQTDINIMKLTALFQILRTHLTECQDGLIYHCSEPRTPNTTIYSISPRFPWFLFSSCLHSCSLSPLCDLPPLSPQLALHSFIPLSSSLYPLHHRCIVTSLNAKRTKAV